MCHDTNIACPKCGAEIPLTEAVSHRVREQLEADFNRRLAESNAALAAREQKLATEKAAPEQRAQAVASEVARQLEAERQKIADAARQQGAEAERLKLADEDNIIKGPQEHEEANHSKQARGARYKISRGREAARAPDHRSVPGHPLNPQPSTLDHPARRHRHVAGRAH
jgi:hypothetical protein